jgi:hypothetical protein
MAPYNPFSPYPGGSIFPPMPGSPPPSPPIPPPGWMGVTAPQPDKNLKGGRLTWDDMNYFGAGMPVILPPDSISESWRKLDLDSDHIRFMSVPQLLRVLAESSPDVSRALWDFLRLTNPGWSATAYIPGTQTPMPAGQKVVDDYLRRLTKLYGSVDVPIGRMHFAAFLRGALFTELVLDEDARTAIDLAVPDPLYARFKQGWDPVRGRVWLLGQFQLGQWVDLSTRETVGYIPIDPAPANPYGRAPATPAIFSSLFLLGLLMDLRRVVAQQGYPRYWLSIALEPLRKTTPPSIQQDPLAWKEWVDTTIGEVQKAYSALQPDDAFVTTDVVTVNAPKGAISADAIAGIDPLIRALERQLARALKTMPLLMGVIEGQSEANANRQWELQAAGIKAIQHLSESQLSEWCTLACEAQGIAAEVRWQFAELRAAEKYRDAMTDGLRIDNATKLWMMGLINQETFADMTTGKPADQPEPRLLPTTEAPYISSTTTGSPTASGEPSNPGSPGRPSPRPTKEEGETGGEAGETGSSLSRIPTGLRWPEFRFWRNGKAEKNGHSQGDYPLRVPGMPLAYIPVEVTYDEGERRRITRLWDESVPEAAGLLDAHAPAPPSPPEESWTPALKQVT